MAANGKKQNLSLLSLSLCRSLSFLYHPHGSMCVSLRFCHVLIALRVATWKSLVFEGGEKKNGGTLSLSFPLCLFFFFPL
jgi:hypothetical protein